ncbi:pyridoxine/pyridoxamine 5'-phosphate oxidase [Nesterenkonia natronophila]|uniref:Pyridoxamine 5'-phosphate oxidase n=1 Tax=Nesterenkonia natronophila TaxID=2174932 RepID=A0A3A4F236_9MICC|nr:pyridoxamine 5'-phosphate oxidase family protein [Nesterenkonia natronophila]RJN31771.1 pyridoxamine 5'-phosphate oxidase [Nesterenkonia natronophila]
MTHATRALLGSIPALTGSPPAFRAGELPTEPVGLFLTWLEVALAAGVEEPRTVALSTVDAGGVPDSRMLILKDVDSRGWAFASTASSRKGQQLSVCPAAALTVWWQPLMRSVRVRGPVVEAPRGESVADLQARSPAAQASVDADDWTLWRVVPNRVEFWQGSPDRAHTRAVYVTEGSAWRVSVAQD